MNLLKDILKKTNDDFFNSIQFQDSVIRRIEIIGEAVKNSSRSTRGLLKYPGKRLQALRDILMSILELIWN